VFQIYAPTIIYIILILIMEEKFFCRRKHAINTERKECKSLKLDNALLKTLDNADLVSDELSINRANCTPISVSTTLTGRAFTTSDKPVVRRARVIPSLHFDNYLPDPIWVHIKSDRERVKMSFVFISDLYAKIRRRLIKNNSFCSHYYNVCDIPSFTLYYCNKPLRDSLISYLDYNIKIGDTVDFEITGLTGGVRLLPPAVGTDSPITTWYEAYGNIYEHSPFISVSSNYGCFTQDVVRNETILYAMLVTIFRRVKESRHGICLNDLNFTVMEYSYSDSSVFRYVPIGDFTNTIIYMGYIIVHIFPSSFHRVAFPYHNALTFGNQIDHPSEYLSSSDSYPYGASTDDSSEDDNSDRYNPYDVQSCVTCFDNTDKDWIVDLIEDVGILIFSIYKSIRPQFDKSALVLSVVTFMKLRSKKSLFKLINETDIISRAEQLFQNVEPQGLEENLRSCRDFLDGYHTLKNSAIFDKLHKFGMYCLTLNIFDKIGVNLDKAGYTVFEQEALKRTYKHNGDFYYTMLDTMLFLVEKGYQTIILKQYHKMFHSGSSYAEYFDKSQLLIRQAKCLHDPATFGIDESQFRRDLSDQIQRGECIRKYNLSMNKFERYEVDKLVNKLHDIQIEITTRGAARQTRRTPFGIVINGPTGIGKSTLSIVFHLIYASLFNKPKDLSFRYTRNPGAKFWDGFDSSMWSLLIDELASTHPDKCMGIDEVMAEILYINNMVPFTPDQAALEDKGKTPLRIDFVTGTTNVKDLHAHYYFSCPSAVQRRFPYIITPTVKEQYLTNNMLDSSKATQQPGEFPDFWTFCIEEVIPEQNICLGKRAKFRIVAQIDNMPDLVRWFSEAAVKFRNNQDRVLESLSTLTDIEICKICFHTTTKCECAPEPDELLCTGCLLLSNNCTCELQSSYVLCALQNIAFNLVAEFASFFMVWLTHWIMNFLIFISCLSRPDLIAGILAYFDNAFNINISVCL
jgi:hypothetical protein